MDDDATAGEAPCETLDLRGLRCPLPVLHTRRALRRLAPGRRLLVLCTDPLAGLDIPHLLGETGDELVAAAREGDASRFVIRRAGAGAGSGGEGPALATRCGQQAERR